MSGETINKDCPCTYPCDRHGNCQACQEYHKGGLTSCQNLKRQTKDK